MVLLKVVIELDVVADVVEVDVSILELDNEPVDAEIDVLPLKVDVVKIVMVGELSI